MEEFVKNIDERIKKKIIELPSIYNNWQSYKNNIHNNQKIINDFDDYMDDWYPDDTVKDVDQVINNLTIDQEIELYNEIVLNDDDDDNEETGLSGINLYGT